MRIDDLSTGVVLGSRFRLVRILGRGSYGDVWLAEVLESEDLPPRVAVKIYHHQERATRKLLEEARVATGFDHPRLVRVFGAERLDGLVIMWMEYVDGETLLQRLGEVDEPKPVSLDEVLDWMHEIAEALAYLHAQEPPLVHGDLKLDNVLIDPEAGARLADFGQSRTIEDRFVETAGVGAWPYLAPEILGASTEGSGKRFVSSDIYAFGVIAYRFLTGRFPRRTISEAINLAPFPRPVELNSSIPVELDELIMRCLEKRPEVRHPTGSALLAAVEELEDQLARREKKQVDLPRKPEPVGPSPAEQIALLAKEMLQAGEVDEVIRWLDETMQRISTSPAVLMVYAEAAKKAERWDAARLVYDRVLRWMKQNDCGDEDMRDPAEHLAEAQVRLKHYEDALRLFHWLVEKWPQNRWYRYRLGINLGLAGHYPKSIEVLQALNDPTRPSAVICAKIGLAYHQLGDNEQAVQYFNEALMLDQFEPIALFNLARIRAIQGRLERALAFLERLEQVEGAQDQANELARLLGRVQKRETG